MVFNSVDFVKKVQNLELAPTDKLVSYVVCSLFTSIPIDKAIKVIEQNLIVDPTIKDRSELNIQQISELLQMCLNTTYFQYNNTFYKQRIGAAMGSPVSPIVANLYMESFEEEALSTARNLPSLWFR